ncbi:MAG: fumarylacetoacetate hydrolase family protein [Acidobacteriota bacterium]|jgi:2-dehydro-3-deoxy-D-arabinonate dehydratase|nr:MAG: fumarylacetoacetate hydrolase [Acidobacteriota bacterium]
MSSRDGAYLTRHSTPEGPRWAVDGRWLPPAFRLDLLLQLPVSAMPAALAALASDQPAEGELLAPIEPSHEVWACGVTYLRSREAREAESTVRDVYARVYDAERPELFFKALGTRVVGHGAEIRVRGDSRWNVPEPELTLVVNAAGEIAGYTVGDDVSSRDIEGENPLYLPQAKVYDGACAIGPGLLLRTADAMADLPIELELSRNGAPVFSGSTRTSQIKRPLAELVGYLYRECRFAGGAFLMTGTGIVPPMEFSLERGDHVRITIGELTLENGVARS